jgi:beta-lactamase class D
MNKVVSSLVSICVLFAFCSPNNITEEDGFKKYFDENKVTGTFALYDNGHGEFNIYNLARYKDSAYLPASTFKIVNSLIGLQTGKISSEKMVIPWNGVYHTLPGGDTLKAWAKDLTMEEAFKASAVPYYQEVARRIGKDTMQFWLDSLKYGSRKITSRVDTFWLDNSLKITADEQLGLVKKLYFDQLPIDKRSQRIVREVMVQERTALYTLAYKTGWGFTENGHALGWIVGWIEENKHPYFFVLNVEGDKGTDMQKVRKNILDSILKEQGFFNGKR